MFTHKYYFKLLNYNLKHKIMFFMSAFSIKIHSIFLKLLCIAFGNIIMETPNDIIYIYLIIIIIIIIITK